MTASTPGCGSNSEARKRLAESTSPALSSCLCPVCGNACVTNHRADPDVIERVLAECDDPPGWTSGDNPGELVYECNCGDKSPVLALVYIGVEDTEKAAKWHRAHVATAVRDALTGGR